MKCTPLDGWGVPYDKIEITKLSTPPKALRALDSEELKRSTAVTKTCTCTARKNCLVDFPSKRPRERKAGLKTNHPHETKSAANGYREGSVSMASTPNRPSFHQTSEASVSGDLGERLPACPSPFSRCCCFVTTSSSTMAAQFAVLPSPRRLIMSRSSGKFCHAPSL